MKNTQSHRSQLWTNVILSFSSKLKEIYFGIYYYIFKNKDVEVIAAERKLKCDSCLNNSTIMKKMDKDYKPWRVDEHCLECKCNLKFKQRSLESKCPSKLW